MLHMRRKIEQVRISFISLIRNNDIYFLINSTLGNAIIHNFFIYFSSRFTDSKRYEACFDRCFDLDGEIRAGEICNACVLLVKRFMKLPSGTLKNWNHVVDARSGPGIKSMVSIYNK